MWPPSPEQPLNGQGMLRIPQLDGPMAKTSGETKEMAQASSTVQGVGSPKNPKRPLVTTMALDQDMALNKSGSDTLLLNPHAAVTDAPQNSSSGTESIPKHSKAKKKTKFQQKTRLNISTLVGPQSDTWTKFFVLNLKPEKDELPMSN